MAVKQSKPKAKWDERLMCEVEQMAYDFRTRTGRLDFPEMNCCHMPGAIALFTAIDPGARVIDTYAGGKPDTLCRLVDGEWTAFTR